MGVIISKRIYIQINIISKKLLKISSLRKYYLMEKDNICLKKRPRNLNHINVRLRLKESIPIQSEFINNSLFSKTVGASCNISSVLSNEQTKTDFDAMEEMGMPTEFRTTKGIKHQDFGELKIKSTRHGRQFMNRRGGFNRPLPAE